MMDVDGDDPATVRIASVHRAQRQLGMQPRADSRLTLQFANGACDPEYPTPEVVAHELWMVDHIYKTTLYGELLENAMRAIAEHLRRDFRLSWPATWDIVRFYAPTLLKLQMLRRSGRYLHLTRAVPRSG